MIVDFKKYSVNFLSETGDISFLREEDDGRLHEFISGKIHLEDQFGKEIAFSEFKTIDIPVFPKRPIPAEEHKSVKFKDHPQGYEAVFTITCRKDSISIKCKSAGLHAVLDGTEVEDSLIPVRVNQDHINGCSAVSGIVFTKLDDAVFNVSKDRLIQFVDRAKWDICFDHAKGKIVFSVPLDPSVMFKIQNNVIAEEYAAAYSPIDKSHLFKTPPVGWMTWYAVKFDACEDVVLKNARQMKEIFGKYNDQLVIWIDWEWCHRGYSGNEDTDVFTPRKDAYPHGLGYMAEKITEMGMVPALWCAPAHDARKNRLMEEHPDWVLGKWRSLWYVDPTHPDIAEKYIPEAFRQFVNWGYKALKWDFLYHFRYAAEDLHENKYDKSVPLASALEKMYRSASETVGKEIYKLYCAIGSDHCLDYFNGNFNAARIGGDVFNWKEFTTNVCRRLLRYYPFHNICFYTDGDNVILRKEFNTMEQVRSRVSLYGLTGLPVTVGDEMDEFDDARIYALSRIMPVVNMTPSSLKPKTLKRGEFIVTAAFDRSYGNWYIASILNSSAEKSVRKTLDFKSELGLNPGKYAVCDFWKQKYLGVYEEKVKVQIKPMDSAVLRVTPLEENCPTVIFSSRHITQGGYEFENVIKADDCLTMDIKCIGNEEELLKFFVPSNVAIQSVNADASIEYSQNGEILDVKITAEKNRSVQLKVFYK